MDHPGRLASFVLSQSLKLQAALCRDSVTGGHELEAPMTLTPDITYRNIRGSAWLRGEIRKRVATLLTFYPDILSCKVLVEVPHRHHERGNQYHIRIELFVPGETIVAGYEPSRDVYRSEDAPARAKRTEIAPARKHASLAFRRAFAAAKRQLQDYARRRRHAVKTHVNVRSVPAPA
jgi:ribosome-associated translation inhibitor RaiA